jgi:two-component system chemotaxis sensor kinase CheA
MSGVPEVKDEYRQLFLEESLDQLGEWEDSLLGIEQNSSDRGLIDGLFRSIHTLKGSAGFVGFEELQYVTHELETALQEIRDRDNQLPAEMVEILFESLDLCRQMVDAFSENRECNVRTEPLFEKLRIIQGKKTTSVSSGEVDTPVEETDKTSVSKDISAKQQRTEDTKTKTYSIEIEIEAKNKEAHLRSLLILTKLENMGTVVTIEPSLEELRLKEEVYKFQVVFETEYNLKELRKDIEIDLVKIHHISPHTEKIGKTSLREKIDKKQEIQNENSRKVVKSEEVVRVPVEKLDVMLNLVGELVVHNSGLISTTNTFKEQYENTEDILDLEEKTESLAKIAWDLQDAVMKVRMLPVATVFNRFNRVVRDIAKDREKHVELEIFGEDTEIDKKVMDRIGEPLVHLVRNALDHGIETKEERLALGKTPEGHIQLGAYQEGDHICIEISDDGRGLDREKILSKAREKGFIKTKEAEELTDEHVYRILFQAGFSTANEVTDLSGRGVGLDVVKKTVEDMGGTLRVKSRPGRGTTITITLPLTMAIIPAILVESASSIFAIPLSLVREVVKTKMSNFTHVGQNAIIRLRDEVISVIYLDDVLSLDAVNEEQKLAEDTDVPILIVGYNEWKIGIGVEKLLGNQEIVIKSLSRHYREIEDLVGASIMGDGSIALILDVETLVRRYYRSEGVEGELSSGKVVRIEGTLVEEEKFNPEDSEKIQEVFVGDERIEETNSMLPESEENDFPINLSENQKKMLEEVHNTGAVNASISMSQLVSRDVRVSFPETKVELINNVATELGGEENYVVGIYVAVYGDLAGGILLVLPIDDVLRFCDILCQRESGMTKEMGGQEKSGISEMGNILAASFINSIADSTELSIHADVPEITDDMCLSVIDSVLARFNQPGDYILLTTAELYFSNEERSVCRMLLFLDTESMEQMVEKLAG